MNKSGAMLCLGYLLIVALCAALAATTDPKGRFVLLQLPIALQIAGIHAIGLDAWLRGWSWPAVYLLLIAPTCAALYGLGWLSTRLRTRTAQQPGPRTTTGSDKHP